MKSEIETAFVTESKIRFENSFKLLFHCLEQLDEQQLWWRPNDKMNSTAILVKHVCGNMRQWTITQINNSEERRNRPAEFLNDHGKTKAELIALAQTLQTDFTNALDNFDTSRLLEPRRIQGSDVTILGAMFHALTHLDGHVGQIALLTRMQLGDNYKIFWAPKTEEQRAEWKEKAPAS